MLTLYLDGWSARFHFGVLVDGDFVVIERLLALEDAEDILVHLKGFQQGRFAVKITTDSPISGYTEI